MVKEIKIRIPNYEFEAMFESEVVANGTGGVVKAMKKYLGKQVVVLVKKDADLIGEDGSFDKLEID